ncbi:MAG: 30S ribosomal protein S3ae [Candidatus Thermoplasmatota archaeon]|nr:30S ribosomal protein S3ae [Candidatus Thermoplasmatota archaeon]
MPRERTKRKKKEKEWYGVLAPHTFGKAKIAEAVADDPEKLINRNVEISLQELTNDFAKSHIKLKFKIVETKGLEANTVFIGHSLTSDYIKRMSRKHKSKVDGVFDIKTKDGIGVRISPSALATKRIQSSQKKAIREILKETAEKEAGTRDFDGFVKLMLDGELGREAYRLSKKIYPIKRVEIYKSKILEIPKIKAMISEEAEEEAGKEILEGNTKEVTEEAVTENEADEEEHLDEQTADVEETEEAAPITPEEIKE